MSYTMSRYVQNSWSKDDEKVPQPRVDAVLLYAHYDSSTGKWHGIWAYKIVKG